MGNLLKPIEWGGQVVITTAQLAEAYGTTSDNINNNFSQNSNRFEAGKHYILLIGEELRQFKNLPVINGVVSKNTSKLYLWTRRGASRHCKILGTDKAWEQFDYLEDNYFEKHPNSIQLTTQEQIQLLAQGNVEINQRVGNLEERMDEFEQNLPLLPEDADDVSREVKKRVIEILGGKDSNAYHDKSLSQTVFKDAYRDLKRNFDVSSYKAIKRHRKGAAVELARSYQAPLYLQERIRDTNAQMTFGGGSCV